jgi:hypothetical protein
VPLALLCLRLAIHWPGPEETHDLVNDLHAHEAYFGLFLFGYLLAGSDAVWAAIRAWWRVAAVLAVAGYLVVVTVLLVWLRADDPPLWSRILFAMARDVQGWNAIVALIGLADRYWNRDHRWRATLNEGVFPFYVIHQTVIVVVAYWVIGHGVPAAMQFAVLVAATVAGCWGFYWVGRAVPPLRPLIGLRFRQAPSVRFADTSPVNGGGLIQR